jgi:hypothetical protein
MDRPEERLALIEVEGRDGRIAQWLDVPDWPMSIGRALDNQLVLDDPYVAARHARLALDGDGQLTLSVLETRNGVTMEGRHLGAGTVAAVPVGGTQLQIGSTRLRLRLPGEALAPERALPRGRPGLRALPAVAGIALLLLQMALHGLSEDPGSDYSTWLPIAVGLPLAVAAWAALWALMSKLFNHRFEFAGHLRIALPWLLAAALVEALGPPLAAALDAGALWYLVPPLTLLMAALMVRDHLALLLPLHPRTVTVAVATVAVAGFAISLALVHRSHDSFSSAPYMSTLPLPGLRLPAAVPTTRLVDDMAPLAERLARRVRKARSDDEDEGADASGD